MTTASSNGWQAGDEWWLEGVLYRELHAPEKGIVGYVDPDISESMAAALNRAEADEVHTQWGVESTNADGNRIVEPVESEERARHLSAYYRVPVVSRRILRTAWTTDEEGK